MVSKSQTQFHRRSRYEDILELVNDNEEALKPFPNRDAVFYKASNKGSYFDGKDHLDRLKVEQRRINERIVRDQMLREYATDLTHRALWDAGAGAAGGYIACIKVNYAERVDNADAFKPQDEELTNTENVSMYHRYIQTPLDPQYETFKEAIKVDHYVKNECWFNTLTDYYKDTLMGDKKREKNKLTKEAILKIINKTEEDFKTKGASITDMAKVFEHFNLQVRISDTFENLIYKRDPIKRNHHIPALYAIVKTITSTQ